MLHGSRQYTMGGAGPIPLSEVLAYFQMFGVRDEDEREEMVAFIRALDSEWLAAERERAEEEEG